MSCLCGLMDNEPKSGSYEKAQMDAKKRPAQRNSRSDPLVVAPTSGMSDNKVASTNDRKLVISTETVEGQDKKSVLRELWMEMKALDQKIAQNWLRFGYCLERTTSPSQGCVIFWLLTFFCLLATVACN
mmetsp:Transcript_5900/g.8341  ORF Transcript_5900/g.8341 Transcript_5900/m.8341 type:complete len:129 (+) Transcript_5900:216-602(+)